MPTPSAKAALTSNTGHRRSRTVATLPPATPTRASGLVRVFLAAGWSVSDLVYALDHAPDGAAHWHTTPVHSPAGWLAARLGWWTDAAGAVRPSPTAQRAAAEAAAGSAATPARRREHLAAIRATLAERLRPA